MSQPTAVLARVATALGHHIVAWKRPECGLTAAERWVARLDDGSSVFVKAATDSETARWLETERTAVASAGTRFAPRIIGWLDDDEFPILITEDLSHAYWPAGTGTTRWRDGDIQAVLRDLEELRGQPRDDLRTIDVPPARWDELLATDLLQRANLCTDAWIANNGPTLTKVDGAVATPQQTLVHGDVRSDNLCITTDGTVRFVDWSDAGTGHPFIDLVNFLPTLHLEGGPSPAAVLTEPVDLITRMAGGTVARAVTDTLSPPWLRTVLLRLAEIDLNWVSSILDLQPPDGRHPSE